MNSSYKLIYNPNAGKKRKLVPGQPNVSVDEIESLCKKYQLEVDFSPTKNPKHARELARESLRKKHTTIIVAGGDGTISEVAQELIGKEATLAILPLGSYMNIAKMLSIPSDLEKAIMLIRLGRTRKIDVGKIVTIHAIEDVHNTYFLEGVGIGLEAQFQRNFYQLEHGDLLGLPRIFKTLLDFYSNKVTLSYDGKKYEERVLSLSIANGPMTGANLQVTPHAKLNDHMLTATVFHMSKWEMVRYLYNLFRLGKAWSPKMRTFQAQTIKIETKHKRAVHADAQVFGTTPLEVTIVPNALSVITGFPDPRIESALKKRTFLDP